MSWSTEFPDIQSYTDKSLWACYPTILAALGPPDSYLQQITRTSFKPPFLSPSLQNPASNSVKQPKVLTLSLTPALLRIGFCLSLHWLFYRFN